MSYNESLYPLPKKYDIVVGYFLERNHLRKNPNKVFKFGVEMELFTDYHHYMIILDVYEKLDMVMVLYGTSIKEEDSERIYGANDFILEDEQHFFNLGIEKDTLFSFNTQNIAIMPYNNRCFNANMRNSNEYSGQRSSPIVGRLEGYYINEIDCILAYDNTSRLMNDLYNNEWNILPVFKRMLYNFN